VTGFPSSGRCFVAANVISAPGAVPLRICLLTGGGYPFRRDALGGWCRALVTGLDQHRFDLVTLVENDRRAGANRLPAHVDSARLIALDEIDSEERGESDERATAAARRLCRALIGLDDEEFAGAAAELAGLPGAPLTRVPLAELLAGNWTAGARENDRERLPRLSPQDARTAATLLRHAGRALCVRLPESDLVHCVGGTGPLLAALAAKWRSGTPVLLTEARPPVSRPRVSEERLSPAVRTLMRRFRSAVARTGYAQAGLIAPLSEFHHAHALRHGAQPPRLVPVPAGADPAGFPTVAEPASGPALVWSGDGGPESGLDWMLDAFKLVRAQVPGVVLHLINLGSRHRERLRATECVRIARPGDGYGIGHVVVHVPAPNDTPYRLVEAMLAGRAIVGADVGPVAETLGDAGVVVPDRDPRTLAEVCVALLTAPARRRALGEAARRRALARFTTDRVVRAYGALYLDLAGPPPAPSFELALAVPAPRDELPATLRWLM
jgi:polysaccharide biosynthesis protein PelF